MAKYSTQKDEEEKKKAQKAEQEKVKPAPSVTADVLKYAQELSGATKKNPASHTPDINPNKNTNIKKTADGDDVFVAPGMENLGPRAAKYVQNVALAGDEKAQKVFANQYGAISSSMNTFKGFTDVDGNAVNMNTADLNSIIRSIRAEPNQKRRTAYAEALEKLTKTPGSRFFGAAFDKNNAKTFLNSAALSQNEYDRIVENYESMFNPQAGHEEENVAAYAEAMEEIEAGGYDAYVKKARIDALNDAYTGQLATDQLPVLTPKSAVETPNEVQEATETSTAGQEPMPKGGAVWNANGEAYTIVDGKAVKVTPDAAPEPIAPSAPSLQEALKDEKFKERYLERLLEKEGKEATDFTKEVLDGMVQKGIDSGDFARFVVDQAMASSVQVASASPVRGVFKGKEKKETFGPERPTIQQEKEHSLSQALRDEAFYGEYQTAVKAREEIPYGSIDLTHDPIKAASYVVAGEVRQLTKETQDALAEIVSESPGFRAVMGVMIDPTQDQLQAAQDGDAHARAFVDATRDYWATGDTNAILGSTLTSYLNLSKSDRFPPSLRDDMQGAIAELAYRAEQAYKNGEFSYDPAKETLYDAYTKLNPASMQLVRGVKDEVAKMYSERKQAEKLAYDEAVKNEQELLKQRRERVASGDYTQEDYDYVLLEAPQVTTQSARTDATYNAMFQEIAIDRTLSDGMEDSWYNQMTEIYLRENGMTDDLFSVEAMQYKDMLAAFEKDILLSDVRIAATLGYDNLEALYTKWGGMDVEKLHERAEMALKQMAENVTDEDIATLESQNLYTGTGEEVGNVEAFGIGTAHGVLDTSGEMLEGIWAFSSMSKEDSVAAVYKVRQDWNKRYGFAGTDMYKHAMYEYCDLIPEEHGKAIREYLDAGYDPFRLGIDPTQESVMLEASKKLDGRAKAMQRWAFKTLDAKQGKLFEVGSATGSTLTMQTVATVTQLGTGNPLIGSLVGYGLVSGNQQIKEELANGATRKEAKTMGYLRAFSDSIANMLSSDKYTEKIRGFVGFGPLVAKGLDAAGDIASARGSLGMLKRYGNIVGKAIKGAGEQILEETVVDPMLEGTTWQIAEAGGRAYLDGAGFIQSVFKGLANIDVMESVEGTVKDAGVNFISTLPLAIIGGLGDGFKASRAAATKLMATGDADAAQAFVEAVVSDLEVPENRDTLNAALHDAAVGQEASITAMTDDENGGKDIDVAAKAQEQADAHAKSEENSMAAAEAGRAAALAAQERMNNGEINPELVTQVANGVLANAKNSQSVLEHRREKNQKQAEADAAFAEGMKKATAKAEAEVSAREEAVAQNAQDNKNVNSRMQADADVISGNDVQKAPYTNMDSVTVNPTKTEGRARTNPSRTYKRLAKNLGIGQAFGTRKLNGLEGRAAGYYESRAGYATSGTNYASSIEVDAHEIGHHLSHRLGITGTPQMVSNLGARFIGNYQPNQLPGEAFSEFFWRYMLSDEEARRFAGDAFVADFERRLRQEGILRDVKRAQTETRQYMLAETDERIRLMIRDKSDKNKDDTVAERFDEMERHFISTMVDSTRPAEDVNSAVREATGGTIQERMNLRNAALMQSTAPKRAFSLLTQNLTDVNGTIVGTGLRERLEASGIRGNQFDTLVEYMLAKHSLDRDAQDKPVFDRSAITQQQTEDFIAQIERDHPEIAAAERAFQEFRHDFMQEYMVATGYMTQEMLDQFERMYPHYVPTYRVKDRGRRGVGGQTYQIRRATGSTEEIVNPIDSFVDMVNTIVAMNLRNETAKTWDRIYQNYEGMGVFGREVTEDQRTQIMNMQNVQEQVRQILDNASVGDDIIQQALDAIGEEQFRRSGTGDVNLPNILTVQMPDGSKRFYEMFDDELFEMFAGTQDSGKSALSILGVLTRGMSMLTTGSNPLFFMRNAMRDYQNSVNYGSWSSNYLTGSMRWLRAAWEVARNSGDYQQYQALGGGGWTRANPSNRRGAEEYRGELFAGYNTSNLGRGLKWGGRELWNAITASRLNEIVEQASRYAEYRFGQHDTTTTEGRQEAYLAAQDVTTDFSRKGISRAASEARMLIPFFNASLQSIYRTGRQFTEAERDRAGIRFVKTVINTGLMSALASAWLIRSLDEEEKDEFIWLSDDLKAKHLYIPNFAPDILGEAPMIRIPLSQDPLSYAIHGAVTNVMWNGEGEEWAIGLCAIAQNILDSVNPVGSTILDPIIATKTNRNWYGSNIVPRRMDGWDPTNQYSEETPDAFIEMSRLLDAGMGVSVSPMMLQYLAEQYTGFVGQIAIPFFTKNEFTGEINGIKAVIQKARNTLTSDPLKSNDVISCVYDNEEFLTTITKAEKNGRPMNMLRNNLTIREAKRAANEAYDLTHKGGAIYDAKKIINDGYDEIDEIEANQSLTDEQKYELTSKVRREMIEAALDANEEMQAFRETYVTGESFLTRFMRAPTIE